jgi:uncharacterized protein RhaS with RHS repeats
LDYDNARYYDPVSGRFISQDPLGFGGRGTDLYSYAQNDPSGLFDPSGLSPVGITADQDWTTRNYIEQFKNKDILFDGDDLRDAWHRNSDPMDWAQLHYTLALTQIRLIRFQIEALQQSVTRYTPCNSPLQNRLDQFIARQELSVRSANTMFTRQSWFAKLRWVRRLAIVITNRPSTRPA